jgi:hypothetical protein
VVGEGTRNRCPSLPVPAINPTMGGGGVGGKVCCGLANPVDTPAPSARGEGMPPPPLEVDGEATGIMVRQVSSQQEERGS